MGTANSTCLGCDSNRRRASFLDEPLKGNNFQARTIPKSSSSDNFWTSRMMDNSAFQSGGSNSLIRTTNNIPDANASRDGNVNQGLLLWNQTRQQWLAKKKPENRAEQLREPRLSINHTFSPPSDPSYLRRLFLIILYTSRAFSAFFGIIFSQFTIFGWYATYDSLLGSNRHFRKPIPLAEMVDFLVDIWEQEGMYD